MITTGVVDEHGTLNLDDLVEFDRGLKRLKGKRVTVKVEAEKKIRSLPQNRYLWGCVYKILADWSGHSAEEFHEMFKAAFLMQRIDVPGGSTIELPGSSTELSTQEFMDFVEKIRMWAIDYGVMIPLPNEVGFDFSEAA